MGQEIDRTGFTQADYLSYQDRLAQETAHLAAAARAGGLSDERYRAGFELEAWLLDHAGYPNPINEPFLQRLGDPWVVQELSRFNVELNGPPVAMGAAALTSLEASLEQTWRRCQDVAHGMDAVLAMVGILPNLRATDLNLDNMSAMKRYVALNREVQRLRGGEPIHIHIEGAEALELLRPDVMLEAATTSFQVHLQVPYAHAGRHYNAALISCGPLLAASGNSPLLFGRRLWQETRVPLFEQSVELGGHGGLADDRVRRASFGQGYVDGDILALFQENLALYPVLLPIPQEGPLERYPHLHLHNGTIWRWVRPLVGFDEAGGCHVRLEQRVLPSGPTIRDMVANAAFHFGLCHALACMTRPPEALLGFSDAKSNFYGAARHGLAVELKWLDGRLHPARDLILETCLPLAREGLADFGVLEDESERYLEVLAQRVRGGQTGAVWQVSNLEREHGDAGRMMANYLENQRTGSPVHEWNPY
jgi:hypothetical protein